MEPNIIFLDFDGVICNPETCIAEGEIAGYNYLDPVSCRLVKRLCEEYNCRIVISSSWRKLYDQYALQGILGAACPSLGHYMYTDERWKTPTINGVPYEEHGRGKEILQWINKYSSEFDNFVILDDDSDMEPLTDNFVHTDAFQGMRLRDFIKAAEILKGNKND
jgi:hypothetical protein